MIGSHRLSKNISKAKYKQPNNSKRSLQNQKYASWQLFAQRSGDILFATWVGLICAVISGALLGAGIDRFFMRPIFKTLIKKALLSQKN